jgi:molybdenum cofactor cytidylyltransferase
MIVAGILLAAGASSRFGSDKLLHPVGAGVPMALASARALAPALDWVVAVLRPGDEALRRLLVAEGIECAQCLRSHDGMGASLGTGVSAATSAQGWLIALADMPFVRTDTIRRIVEALAAGAPIAVPRYAGRQGHPVGFAADFGFELRSIQGDVGARSVLERHAAEIVWVDCDDPGVLRDVDVPADLDEGR